MDKEEWQETLWSHGGRTSLERIEKTGGPQALAQFKTECLECLDGHMGPGGFGQSFDVLYNLAVKPI